MSQALNWFIYSRLCSHYDQGRQGAGLESGWWAATGAGDQRWMGTQGAGIGELVTTTRDSYVFLWHKTWTLEFCLKGKNIIFIF